MKRNSFQKKPQKIFFDEKGLRWTRTKLVAGLFVSVLIVTIIFSWPALVNSQDQSFDQSSSPKFALNYPKNLAYSKYLKEIPMIGEGHLIRIMEVRGVELVEPFTGEKKLIQEKELPLLKKKKYVIEKYNEHKGRYLAVTFDDGPDPAYTPKILDILAREKVQATFFVTGKNAVRYPELTKRIVQEGHLIGNHSFSHIDFDKKSSLRENQEFVVTDRVLRTLTERGTNYVRLPYNGGEEDDVEIKNNLRGVLQAQQLGYKIVLYNLDTKDWQLSSNISEVPSLTEDGTIALFHDSGGNRNPTIDYLERLIKKAKTEKYQFFNLSQLEGEPVKDYYPVKPKLIDRFSLLSAKIFFVYPTILIRALFGFTILNLILYSVFNVTFAFLSKRKNNKKLWSKKYHPLVSVLIPAFNEEQVIKKTIRSILCSKYRKLEVIIVNDGSTDKTGKIIKKLRQKYPSLILINQENTGKAGALNTGIKKAKGEIIVTGDADTLFLKETIPSLVRHFGNRKIGAVAGFVKVGNRNSFLTAWQALEYLSGITLERLAHSYFNTIMINPGACSAWRKKAILKSGGYSKETMTEDCDLTLTIQKNGYQVTSDMEAIALTEAPKNISDLLKQRFRWMFGNLQTFWKHKDMILNPRYGFLGMFILPQAIFSFLVQLLFLPFTYLLILSHFFAGEYKTILFYFLLLLAFQFILSLFAILIGNEKFSHLLVVPFYRLVAEPLRIFLLYSSLLAILKGRMINWNKIKRLGEVDLDNRQKRERFREFLRKKFKEQAL